MKPTPSRTPPDPENPLSRVRPRFAPHPARRPPTEAGTGAAAAFTLLELMGTLALVAVLVATAAPNLIQIAHEKVRREESRQMDRIAEAVPRIVTLYKTVPSTNVADWGPLVALELGLPDDVVILNRAGTPRRLVFDPALNIGGIGPASLPFRQTAAGATNLVNPRLIVVSSLTPGYPAVDLASVAGFSNLWNRVEHRLPADWPTNWAADPDDLVIRRVDLTGVFHELALNNLDRYARAPFALLTNSLQGAGHSNVLSTTNLPIASRFIHGTPLRLYSADGLPQAVTLITSDVSYSFEGGRWTRRVQSGINGTGTCGVLGGLVETFMNHPSWNATANGTTPSSVVLGMFDMLCGCADWSAAGFENENGHSKWEAPTARFVFDIAPQLMLSSQDLIGQ